MRKYQQNRIFIPNSPLSPRICPELATEIGLNESIIFLQLEFWLATEGEEIEGVLWVRRPLREIQQTFSFWGLGTVQRAIKKLVDKKYILTADHDTSGPGGQWFALNFPKLKSIKSIKTVIQNGTSLDPSRNTSCSKSDRPPIEEEIKKDVRVAVPQEKPRQESVKKDPPEPTFVIPPPDFKITDEMRSHVGTANPELTSAQMSKATPIWRANRIKQPRQKKYGLTYEGWEWDWIEWMMRQNPLGSNGNGYSSQPEPPRQRTQYEIMKERGEIR